MDYKKVTNVYLILSIALLFCFPFTALIALSYAIKSRNAVRSGAAAEEEVTALLDSCYKWIITTLKIFIVVYILLLAFFLVLPRL